MLVYGMEEYAFQGVGLAMVDPATAPLGSTLYLVINSSMCRRNHTHLLYLLEYYSINSKTIGLLAQECAENV